MWVDTSYKDVRFANGELFGFVLTHNLLEIREPRNQPAKAVRVFVDVPDKFSCIPPYRSEIAKMYIIEYARFMVNGISEICLLATPENMHIISKLHEFVKYEKQNSI